MCKPTRFVAMMDMHTDLTTVAICRGRQRAVWCDLFHGCYGTKLTGKLAVAGCPASVLLLGGSLRRQEAIGVLERVREDFKHAKWRMKQRFASLQLHHDRKYTEGCVGLSRIICGSRPSAFSSGATVRHVA